MPLGLIAGLPAGEVLAAEGVQIVPLDTPAALKLLCLNLMPLKESTERQLGRNFGQSHITVDLHFAMPDTASGRNSSPEHLSKYYTKFSEAANQQWDGVIVTGAPIEHLPFEEVNYWPEMVRIMDWIRERELACYYLCWGAFAALNHYYGIPMHPAQGKLFGLYPLEVVQECEMTENLQMPLSVPVSRHTYLSMDDMHKLDEGVCVVLDQKETGPCVMWDPERCFCYIMNHFEYEWDTLDGEYRRDLAKGAPMGSKVQIPAHYYPDDDPSRQVIHSWLKNGIVFYNNWILQVQKRKVARHPLSSRL